MNIRITLFFAVTALYFHVSAQIPNNGFENWTDMGAYSLPDGWGNLNPVTPTAVVYTCVKGTPGNPGTAFIKLSSRTVAGMGIQPGIAVSGILNTSTYEAVSGFPYTDRPESLDGSWQYMAGGSDQGYIAVYLTKWNAGLNQRDTIAWFKYPLPGMVMEWRNFSLPLTYSGSAYPDSAMIILSASGKTPVNGSYLYIDNLAFAGGTVGLNILTNPDLVFYPNPVTRDKLIISLKRKDFTAESIEIFDLYGDRVTVITMADQQFPYTLDVSSLPPGQYFFRINSEGNNVVQKFIKQ